MAANTATMPQNYQMHHYPKITWAKIPKIFSTGILTRSQRRWTLLQNVHRCYSSSFPSVAPQRPNANSLGHHLKINTGKECSSAECARLRSRLHCVATRRVASTRQGVRRAPQFDFRHRPPSCVSHATSCPGGIRNARPVPHSVENSPAIHGWDSWPANFQSPVRDERTVLPSLAGLLHLIDVLPSHKWPGYCHRVAPRRPTANCPQSSIPK
jgi:hypothetical protein